MPLSVIRFHVLGRAWLADLTRPADLGVPIRFSPDAPVWFGAPAPTSGPLEGPGFVGDVSQGGSVNVSTLSLTPHCVGTHTESVGHLTRDPYPVDSIITPGLWPASLITPRNGSVKEMEARLKEVEAGFAEGLILRGHPSAGFHPDALALVVEAGVRHLIVERVSVDPEEDGGTLAAHRVYWGMPPGSTAGWSPRTITELARVPPHLADGPFLLDLQTPRMVTDAVPSRPVLYPVLTAD